MKKLIIILTTALALSIGASAQSVDKFHQDWRISVLGGVNYVSSDGWTMNAFKTISPNFQVGLEYYFLPWLGARVTGSGMMGKYPTNPYQEHQFTGSFNYVMVGADAVFDLLNIGEYNSARLMSPYAFLGGALASRFKTGNAESAFGPAFRAGLGVNLRLGQSVKLALELQSNTLGNQFNTLDDNGVFGASLDDSFAALAGLQFSLGGQRRREEAAAREERIAAAKAAQAAAAQATADRIAAARAADRARSERLAAEREALARGENPRAVEERIIFGPGKSDLPPSENSKLLRILNVLNTYPETKVTVSGYADKDTEPAANNLTLSVLRADAVKKALIDAGIDASRITTKYYGDSQQVSTVSGANRVVVCETK